MFAVTLGHTWAPSSIKLPESYQIKLSAYGFFKGKPADLQPVNGVTPYTP
ncbi:hypothetical protein M23134_08360 [Microscilla marina ATCC 23134]|uniref:Uncharacterized protein n=1 Tax=Microscilla marina ATCC 23134 TaxID=313606 RepID=A1ZQN6_MICM2|nr:hypothetical protein M23134_08360 [Microscilla marina ATCC 23134]